MPTISETLRFRLFRPHLTVPHLGSRAPENSHPLGTLRGGGIGSTTAGDAKILGRSSPFDKTERYLHLTYVPPPIHLESSLDCL